VLAAPAQFTLSELQSVGPALSTEAAAVFDRTI
jgi:hypothetical protein